MTQPKKHIFNLGEAALAYALCAEQIFGDNGAFLTNNSAVMPIFVSLLFQSLEISIKHVGIESGLFTSKEARDRHRGAGHGINEIAQLAVDRLGGDDPKESLVMAMTYGIRGNVRAQDIIGKMICADEFANTRKCYSSRRLGYAEVDDGEFAYMRPIQEWIESVKQTALNLDSAINILKQWKESPSQSKHFAIWLKKQC